MSRILRAIQILTHHAEEPPEPATIPITDALGRSEPQPPPRDGLRLWQGASQAKNGGQDLIRRFDVAHPWDQAPFASHLPPPKQDQAPPQPDRLDTSRRVCPQLEELQAVALRQAKSLAESWLLAESWRLASSSAPGRVSLQWVDEAVPLDAVLGTFLIVAEKAGRPILLIDADCATGETSRLLGLCQNSGFAEVFLGQVELEDALVWIVPNQLAILPRGQLPLDSFPNWLSPKQLLEKARQLFPYVVVICPLGGAKILDHVLEQADDVWLWSVAGETSSRWVQSVKRQTERQQKHIAGAVLVSH